VTDLQLTQEQFVARLDGWVGAVVAVRVVADDQLLAVIQGRLGERSTARPPALFWPLQLPEPGQFEEPGIYLHPDVFDTASMHEGGFVLELRQSAVTLNIRRL
jgi:hypothetical protein